MEEARLHCPTCEDSGIEYLTHGMHKTVGGIGIEGVWVDAAVTSIARPCKGPRGEGCRWHQWRAAERAKVKAVSTTTRRELSL